MPPQEPTQSTRSNGPKLQSLVKKEEEEPGFKQSFRFIVNMNVEESTNTVHRHTVIEYRRKERWEQNKKRQSGSAQENEQQAANQKSLASSSDQAVVSDNHSSPTSSDSVAGRGPKKKRPRLAQHLLNYKGGSELAAITPDYEEALKELEQRQDLPYHADPHAAITASDTDPFSRMQIDLGSATKALIYHFAVHDPKPAHVILGFTLSHIAGLRGIAEPPLAIEHKNHAFNLIQERMSNPEEAISNDNIGAIVNVASWELINCNPQGFTLHMSGLHRIITGRGGIKALSHKPELQTVLVRLDAVRAYIALSASRYPLYACFRTLQPFAINIPLTSNTALPLSVENPEFAFCEDTLYLLHTLEDVLLLLRSISCNFLGPKFSRPIRDLVSASIQQCLSPSAIQVSPSSEHVSRKCNRLATLVFLDAAIQHFFDGDTANSGYKRLTTRFLRARRYNAVMATWARSLEMVIHVLLVAETPTLQRPWRAYYFADALTWTMKLGLESWGEVERSLRGYLEERVHESETLVGPPSARLWDIKEVYEGMQGEWTAWMDFPVV